MNITEIDKNFVTAKADENGFIFYDITEAPLKLEGLPFFRENNNTFFRVPQTFIEQDVSAGLLYLANHTAGAAVRFKSDSPQITIRATLRESLDMNHMPRAGSAGFDSYFKRPGEKTYRYNKTVQPAPKQETIEAIGGINPDKEMCDWIINLPLYGGVAKVEIGIKADSTILPPADHKIAKPVLFYGSSITQGGCASRPGNAYTSMLCRAIDAEQINLGFSGNAKGEIAMANLIASLDLAAFVYDYDHNAPSVEHLADTHGKFFKIIREAHPDLPVIMISKCDIRQIDPKIRQKNILRREIIRKTWQNAINSGDKNVYFIDGETLFDGELYDACTVDGCHPNDLGFFRMYTRILPVLQKAIGIK